MALWRDSVHQPVVVICLQNKKKVKLSGSWVAELADGRFLSKMVT